MYLVKYKDTRKAGQQWLAFFRQSLMPSASAFTCMKAHKAGTMNYKNSRWHNKRECILKRDGYLCQHFKRYGKNVEAQMVHHIYPVEDYPEYSLCDWNLISLSNKAHNMMHDRDTHKLTALGMQLQERVRAQKEAYDKKFLSPPGL